MNLSLNGEHFIQNVEGLRLRAYRDAFGKWTVGYGHFIAAAEEKLYLNRLLTGAEATAIFEKDVARFVTALIATLHGTAVSINQNQFDALVAFIFNIGIGAWDGSTARRDLIAGKLNLLPMEMRRWTKDDHGNICKGLVNRREAEIVLFNKAPTK